jgi:hypothetical protein
MQTSPAIMSEVLNKEYSIVRLSKDNIKKLALLHSEVYGTDLNEDYFSRKYNTAYTGIEHTGFIACNKDNFPIAYYGVIPCLLKYGSEIIPAAQSADTMTHPNFRYKGMFTELSNITFDLCKQLEIKLIFGFPNQNSYHGAISKLGWKETETMSCFTIPVNAFPVESVSKKLKLHGIYKRYRESVFNKRLNCIDGVSNSAIDDGFAGVYRSKEYLSYKTYSRTKVLTLKNAQVWVSNRSGLLIGDIKNVEEKDFGETIGQLKKIAAKLGSRHLQFHCSPGTSLHSLFSTCSQVSKSFPVLFQDFGCPFSLDKIKFTFADIDIF